MKSTLIRDDLYTKEQAYLYVKKFAQNHNGYVLDLTNHGLITIKGMFENDKTCFLTYHYDITNHTLSLVTTENMEEKLINYGKMILTT